MSKQQPIEVEGVITEALGNSIFRAQLKNDEKEHTYIPVDKLKVIHCYKKEYELDPSLMTN